MKKITLLLLGVLMTTGVIASEYEYVPLVREGVVWEYVGYNQVEQYRYNSIPQLYTLEFNGTIYFINPDGSTDEYNKLYRTDYDGQSVVSEPYVVAYVREEGKVVDAIPNEMDNINYWWFIPVTLYDFNKPMFLPDMDPTYWDNIPYPYDINNSTLIELEIAETIRKAYQITYDINWYGTMSNNFKTIEGIGVDCDFGDLLVPYREFYTGINPRAGLSAVYENGELVYKGCLYDEAQKLKNPDAITTVTSDRQVTSVRYYNLAGVESAEPQQGVNFRVTTYTDGSRSSKKILR